MKSFILILSLFFFAKTQDTAALRYSKDDFIEYLKEEGYYNILVDVKSNFGDDVAILMCRTLIPSIHCNEVVRNNMKIPENYGRVNEDLITFLESKKYSKILSKIPRYEFLIEQVAKIKQK